MSKQDIFQFISAIYPVLLDKWEKELKVSINACSNKYAAIGLHGSGAYFTAIHDLMDKNIENIIKSLIETTLNAFSSKKISDFTISELTEALNELTYYALDKYEAILNEQMKPYSDRRVIKRIESVLKEELRQNTHTNLLLLLNKFEPRILNEKITNNSEKKDFKLLNLLKKIIRPFIAPIYGWIFMLISTSAAVIKWFGTIKNFIVQHIVIIVIAFLILALLAICFYLAIKLYRNSRKKIVNRISVDKSGECFCPSCFKILVIKGSGSAFHDLSHFVCNICNNELNPISQQNGSTIDARSFYVFQKNNPQVTYTK